MVLPSNDFTYGLLTPGLALAMSCTGAFLGLRCTTRALSFEGAGRVRWLLLGGLSIGAAGIWGMSFVAMLGFTIPGMDVYWNLPMTIVSLVVAIGVASGGLLFAGLAPPRFWWLLLGGVFTGLGIGLIHYLCMAAMRMPGRVTYDAVQLILSFAIAIVLATATLWAVQRVDGVVPTLGAAVIIGIAVSGMHYTGMAAMRMYSAAGPAGMVMGSGSGDTTESFLLPVIAGVIVLLFVMAAAIMLSPTAQEIRYDQALLERLEGGWRSVMPQGQENLATNGYRGGHDVQVHEDPPSPRQ